MLVRVQKKKKTHQKHLQKASAMLSYEMSVMDAT